MKVREPIFFTLLVALFATSPAEARGGLGGLFKIGKGIRALEASKTYDARTLSVVQLKVCVLAENEIEVSSQNLDVLFVTVSDFENRLKFQSTSLDLQNQTLSRMSEIGFSTQEEADNFNKNVDAYNQALHAYNNLFKLYEKEVGSYNDLVAKHDVDVANFTDSCVGKTYYEDDLVQVHELIGVDR